MQVAAHRVQCQHDAMHWELVITLGTMGFIDVSAVGLVDVSAVGLVDVSAVGV